MHQAQDPLGHVVIFPHCMHAHVHGAAQERRFTMHMRMHLVSMQLHTSPGGSTGLPAAGPWPASQVWRYRLYLPPPLPASSDPCWCLRMASCQHQLLDQMQQSG